MLKNLKSYLNSFKCFNKLLPKEIRDTERIVRSIYSPINLSKDQKKIKANAFRPPAESEDISVNRLDYTNSTFCKKLGKKGENPNFKRNYFGFALLTAQKIRNTGSSILYTPITKPKKDYNKYHADIKIGYKPIKNQQLPAEIQFRINNLAKQAKLFTDPKPNSKNWEGPELL